MKGVWCLVLLGAIVLGADRVGAPSRRDSGSTRLQEVSHVDFN